jgi:glyoxylase-like metal-dependent hydrolase (beta-lactamase superfamily II)
MVRERKICRRYTVLAIMTWGGHPWPTEREEMASMTTTDLPVCGTCGVQYDQEDFDPAICRICTDERQYVGWSGQKWTSTAELVAGGHHGVVRFEEPGLWGVGTEPSFAIGQRALLVPGAGGNLLWDCTSVLDDATVAAVEERGGIAAIAISHPHYYTGMVEWAHRFDCPVYIHADDERWIMRPDSAVELWHGDVRELGDGLTLVRCGGHFAGGTVLHWEARRALLSGDIVQVIPDRSHVGFMYSYPNLIPLPGESVQAIARALEPYAFETIYGAWWGRIVRGDAKGIVERSAERYVRALAGELPEGA